ncbi:hypothetical protein M5689_003224 [Euphorbia peplus]|nr:hypothetical protein M5689_003224 [Euphorbia peplus]
MEGDSQSVNQVIDAPMRHPVNISTPNVVRNSNPEIRGIDIFPESSTLPQLNRRKRGRPTIGTSTMRGRGVGQLARGRGVRQLARGRGGSRPWEVY